MIPTLQTRFGGTEAPWEDQGNCHAACLASIFDVTLSDIPDPDPQRRGYAGVRGDRMTQAQAIARVQRLKESLLDHGVRSVSIELVQGRPGGPNGAWWTDTFVGTLGHHIVSRRSQGVTPFLSLVKKGRVDLPGPICNGYGGFDEIARIICLGWANHPGRGGPREVEAGIIPQNNGRPYLFGWEFEGGIDPDDWPDTFREFMGRCHAGTLDWLGRTEKSHLEHKTWATPIGRKVDRLGYTLATARAETARYLEDPMTPTQARLEVAVAWYAKAGVWMDGVSGEDPQARLTRLANEHLAGRELADITQHIGRVRNPQPGEAVPAWVLDPTATSAAPIYGGSRNAVDQLARQQVVALRNHLRKS